jgi:RHS repeat-associated protein
VNENETQPAYFDDFEITHKANPQKLTVSSWAEYYAFGKVAKASCSPPSGAGGLAYRYGYQGEFAEKDQETEWNSFELRQYDSEIGRFTTTDPMGEFWSSYVGMGNDPVNLTDPTGGETNSTHTDKFGKVIAVFNDGDMGVYRHCDIDASTWNGNKSGLVGGGELMGHTQYWDEFAFHDMSGNVFARPAENAFIAFGVSMDDYVAKMGKYAATQIYKNQDFFKGGAQWLADNSGNGKDLDIKVKVGAHCGYLFGGFYTSGESLGNYLFGKNLANFYTAPTPYRGYYQGWWDTAMPKAGAYHNKQNHVNNPRQAPYFGEIPYSGRRIAMGYWGSKGFKVFLNRYPNATRSFNE